MKEQMKKIALLSLSLILTSAYSVSIVLPSLLQHFSEYTTAHDCGRSASFIGQRHGTGVCTGISGDVRVQDFPGDRDWAH